MNREAGEELSRRVTPSPLELSQQRLSAAERLNGPGAHSDLHRMQKADIQERDTNKIFLAISRVVTSSHEATTLGIILGISRHDVMYRVTNYDVRDVAYRFLCWAEDNCGKVEKWEKIIEALTQLEKNNTILELGLQERLAAAEREMQRVPLVQNSATST